MKVSLGEGNVVRSSPKALLVSLESGEEVWIPLSVFHDDSEVYDDGENASGEIVVQSWWAEREGLA